MSTIFERYKDLCDPAFIEQYPLEGCFTARQDEVILDLDVAVALLRYEGNTTKVAVALKRGRRAIDTYISRDAMLSDLREDIQDMFMDDIEEKARMLARAGDAGLVKFVLSTIGKKRGYVTRVEATGKDGKDLNVVFYLPENGRENTGEVENV